MDPRHWLFDRRIVRRNLENEILPVEQYEEHLRGLRDVKLESEQVEVMLYPSDEQEAGEQKGDDSTMDNSRGAPNE